MKTPTSLYHGVRFGVAGGFVFCLDFALVWAWHWFLPPILAVSLAYVMAVSTHFWLNRIWVFEGRDRPVFPQLGRYVITVAACWFTTVLIVSGALRWWTDQVLLAKAAAMPPVALLGFLLMRGFVFRNRSE